MASEMTVSRCAAAARRALLLRGRLTRLGPRLREAPAQAPPCASPARRRALTSVAGEAVSHATPQITKPPLYSSRVVIAADKTRVKVAIAGVPSSGASDSSSSRKSSSAGASAAPRRRPKGRRADPRPRFRPPPPASPPRHRRLLRLRLQRGQASSARTRVPSSPAAAAASRTPASTSNGATPYFSAARVAVSAAIANGAPTTSTLVEPSDRAAAAAGPRRPRPRRGPFWLVRGGSGREGPALLRRLRDERLVRRLRRLRRLRRRLGGRPASSASWMCAQSRRRRRAGEEQLRPLGLPFRPSAWRSASSSAAKRASVRAYPPPRVVPQPRAPPCGAARTPRVPAAASASASASASAPATSPSPPSASTR